ncbi:RdgB/HAM1 family non-canonical purine NTP pyrophosphatase [Candidatus Odyssella thessalonicensis]|uniref:RdgB/HAM1 family non-canonical purine NTP pyrophosphatase n=1 Tax=Candidatus Odyssella thessalonicensis TaxID=84647 RepID=UPI000225BECB|nr:RdgB/HAM1 family non-canonical purine NTP pyrophosphatase [Candidatus Odyssella thessalonicensis]
MLKPGDTLVIASHNSGKIKEIREMLAAFSLNLVSARDLNIAEPEETGTTFVENSVLKATSIMEACQLPCLADDSGLCVEALNGAPGVYSARWAERANGERDFNYAFAKIFDSLDRSQSYSAQMRCVLTLSFPQGAIHSFDGIVNGHISLPPRGEHAFGYDPIFTPEGYNQTFAQMDPSLKSQISHRRHAFKQLVKFIS